MSDLIPVPRSGGSVCLRCKESPVTEHSDYCPTCLPAPSKPLPVPRSQATAGDCAAVERGPEPTHYGCGWCPMLLPSDPTEWTHHFLTSHNMTGYSVRYLYDAPDWDAALAALDPATATRGDR